MNVQHRMKTRMIKRIIGITLATLLLSGCGTFGKRELVTQTIKVQVPVLYSPEPPVLTRPDLAIHELPAGARNNYAQIARHYKITVIQLLNYVEQLEIVLDDYKLISETLDKTGVLINDGIEVKVD